MVAELELLIERQRAEGMNDTEFGNALGYTREYWNYIKNGKAKITDAFRMKAYRAYPDIFLSNDITKVKKDITEVTQDSPQTSPERNSGGFWRLLKRLFKRS